MEITQDIILRAWRDEDYLNSLAESTRNRIPARPTREDGTELSDAELEEAAGGGPILAGALLVGGVGLAGYGIGKGVSALTD